MGLPQSTHHQINQPPAPNESVSVVIGHIDGTLNELECRLVNLRERLETRPPAGETAQASVRPAGLLSNAMTLRNTSLRLNNLVTEIENLI